MYYKRFVAPYHNEKNVESVGGVKRVAYCLPYHNVNGVQLYEVSNVSRLLVNITVSVPLELTNENRYLKIKTFGRQIFGVHEVNYLLFCNSPL